MADTGAPHSIPYPIFSDAPAGHTQMQSLATQVATRLGFVGKTVIATEESRTNTAYGLMTTADHVQSVVVPANSIVQVRYHATWKESSSGAGRAAIFIGSNQVKRAATGAAPVVLETAPAVTNIYRPLVSDPRYGLVPLDSATGYSGDVSTGQLIGGQSNADQEGGATTLSYGGVAEFFVVTGGTYDVSVQFKASAGSVSVKDRRLYVSVLPF